MTRANDMPESAPHVDLSLERQVLGEIIGFDAYALYVGAGLRVDDFFRLAHRLIFKAIVAVEGADTRADLVTVGTELRRRGELDEAGGPAYIARLIDGIVRPTSATADMLTGQLADLAARRDLAAAVVKEPLEALATLLDRSIARGPEERRTFDAAGQLETIRKDIARDRAGRLWTGFPTLDNTLEGLRPGEVLGLMARPGIGKTLVLCHITRAVAEVASAHVFFSLEMPAPQIVQRIATAHYGLHKNALRDRLDAGLLDTADYIENFQRFMLIDTPGLDVARMSSKLRQLQAGPLKGIPIRLVTIDHLGLIGGDRKMTTYDRVSTQSRELKELAKRFECTVILAIQVNREAGGDGSKELSLGSARDSGVVEEAVDYLLGMRRLDRATTLNAIERERYKDVLFVKVIKHRHATPDSELAIRINPQTLSLIEDADFAIAENDIDRIAASAGRGRR